MDSGVNRVKVWIFTLLVVAAGAAALLSHAASEKAAALAALDARLAAGAAQASAALRTSLRETAAAAALAAREPALRAALAPKAEAPPLPRRPGKAPPPAPAVDPAQEEAAQAAAAAAALEGAEQLLGAPLPAGRVVLAASAASLARKPVGGDTDALLRGAVEGTARAAYARNDGKLWTAAAVPAGDGAGVVVLAPLADAWSRALSKGAGVDVTVGGTELKPSGNAPPADTLPILAAATKAAGKVADVGAMAPVEVAGGLPIALPKLGLLLDRAPAFRVLAVQVEGLKGAVVVLSAPVGAALAPVAQLQWRGLALLLVLLLVGVIFGFLVKPSEIVPAVPEELVAAAAKIERGDFTARAPTMAGKLGTIASALNRAAEAAVTGTGGLGLGADSGPSTAGTGEFFQEPPPPPEAEPSAFDFPARPPRHKPVEEARPALSGDPFQAAPVRPAPQAAPPPMPAAPPPIPNATMTRTMPAVVVDDESTHWQQVFQDFVRTRAECGEPSEGLTFERFRAKLESNKATLVQKYQCRTVRFQVYVKDGKAALKATPVR